jgi:hypothetical protein
MNFLEKLWANLRGLAVKETTPLTELRLADSDPGPVKRLKGGKHYFQLRVTDLQLKYSRAWFTEWFPALSSIVQLRYGGRERPTLCRFASPPKESLAPGVYKGYALTDLLPYNGGDVEVDVGLLGLKGDNALVLSLRLIEDFSELVAVPLSASFRVADKLAGAFDKVLTQAAEKVHLRFHDTFSEVGAPPFEPHYRVILLAASGTVAEKDLAMVSGRLHRRNADGSTSPFAGHDFFVVRVEAAEERTDFTCLPEIESAVKRAMDAWTDGAASDVYEKHKRAAIAAAMTSPDLVEDDRTRVVVALQKKFALIQGALGLAATAEDKPLGEFIGENAPTLSEARLRGPFTWDEAMQL